MNKLPQALLLIIAILILVSVSCKKEEKQELSTVYESPFCEISTPVDGQIFNVGDSVLIRINASSDRIITDVRFFIDSIGIGSLSGPPYEYTISSNGSSFGVHSIIVVVVDSIGLKSSDTVLITYMDGRPIASFMAAPTTGDFPLNVSFTDQSLNNPVTFYWDFGDGNTSTQQNPTHDYNVGGELTVSMIASNTYGSDTIVKQRLIVISGGNYGTFTDPRDGQVYRTIDIGDQTWFADNLNYKTLNSKWYNDDSLNGEIYGSLYWRSDALTACPASYKLPGDNDWAELEEYLGMNPEEVDNFGFRGFGVGTRMKSKHSWDDNGNGNNSSGFEALAGGFRDESGHYRQLGETGGWWTRDIYSYPGYYARKLLSSTSFVWRGYSSQSTRYSVRCIKIQYIQSSDSLK